MDEGFFVEEKYIMALSALEVRNLKQAPAVEGVLPVVLNRWSSRAFSAREVTTADLSKLFEAARWAASAFNEQPWRFVVGRRGTAAHEALAGCLIGFNQSWAGNAPVLILTVASTRFAHNGKENGYALYDLGAASATLTLQASEQGMTTHTMAGFDPQAARKAFEIPAEFAIGTVIALGYQGEPESLQAEQLIALEITPRTRKPLNELVFSAWNEPADLA
jgi:nitroreductase